MWDLTVLSAMYSSSAISLLVRPRGHGGQYLFLAVRERLDGLRRPRGGPGVRERLQQPCGDAGRDERVTTGGGVDGLGEQVGTGVLEQETPGTGPQRGVDVLVEVERGDDDDGERVLDSRPGQSAGRLDAVHAGHADVEQAHVRPQAAAPARRPAARRAASPTTSMSGWASSIIVSPVRTISWSSATSTRMLMRSTRPGAVRRSRSSRGPDSGPASQVPPSRPARSIMPTRPYPGGAGGRRAASPSSLTRRRTDVSSAATRTSMRVACRACRRALVTDSWASR